MSGRSLVRPLAISEIIVALPPRLIVELAKLNGQSDDDLRITFDFFDLRDRLSLLGLNLIALDSSNGRSVKRILPDLHEIISLAALLTAEIAAEHMDDLAVKARNFGL